LSIAPIEAAVVVVDEEDDVLGIVDPGEKPPEIHRSRAVHKYSPASLDFWVRRDRRVVNAHARRRDAMALLASWKSKSVI
jgi:hypothetical protein